MSSSAYTTNGKNMILNRMYKTNPDYTAPKYFGIGDDDTPATSGDIELGNIQEITTGVEYKEFITGFPIFNEAEKRVEVRGVLTTVDADGVLIKEVGEFNDDGKPSGKIVVAFTETGSHTWTAPEGVTNVDVLVVAGGGGGGSGNGGGGGAGGLIFEENFDISGETNPISITIGEGGSGSSGDTVDGQNGENSSFLTIEALGGGGGGMWTSFGLDGGSGGGGSGRTGSSGGSGTVNQGNDGGNASPSGSAGQGAGGGGGGATTAGANALATGNGYGGDGGDGGDYSTIFGTTYGENGVFAGGGGGGGVSQSGSGGNGGGGNGSTGTSNPIGEDGLVNTGGGGGGGIWGTSGSCGNGGSGIVLIAYELPIIKSDLIFRSVIIPISKSNTDEVQFSFRHKMK